MQLPPDATMQQLVAAIGTPFVLSEDDYLALETLVIRINHEIQSDVARWSEDVQQTQVNAVVDQLQEWFEERYVRPERVRARRERHYKSKLGRSSRSHVLRAERPAWQRACYTRGLGTRLHR